MKMEAIHESNAEDSIQSCKQRAQEVNAKGSLAQGSLAQESNEIDEDCNIMMSEGVSKLTRKFPSISNPFLNNKHQSLLIDVEDFDSSEELELEPTLTANNTELLFKMTR